MGARAADKEGIYLRFTSQTHTHLSPVAHWNRLERKQVELFYGKSRDSRLQVRRRAKDRCGRSGLRRRMRKSV